MRCVILSGCAQCAKKNHLEPDQEIQTCDLSEECLMNKKKELNEPADIFSSPEPKAQGELIGWDSSQRLSVHLSILSNMSISETSWSIIITFHQKYHWGGGLTALGFGPDRIRILVSMATVSSHRVIMGKTL